MLSARIKYLVERYFADTASTAEREELALWIDTAATQEQLEEALGDAWASHVPQTEMPEAMSDRIEKTLFSVVPERQPARIIRYGWWAAASVLLLGAGSWWALRHNKTTTPVIADKQSRYKNEVAPGGNKATLTLADGSVITLDSAGNGLLAQQGNIKIVKQRNGELTYEGSGAGEKMYNKMVTPRGGQYRLALPDGTIAWLNAASSISFPAAFSGDNRKVNITGEVYFEVAADAHHPFVVNAGTVDITVLGTRFNVNAYDQLPDIRTTLLDGGVKVSSAGVNTLLKPGQQAQVDHHGALMVKNNVDTDEIIAWKNGFFQFTDADMPTVMQQIEQWYDVKVSYEGAIPKRSFGGGIQRSLPLSEVLGILEANDVKFKIEGKNITVLK